MAQRPGVPVKALRILGGALAALVLLAAGALALVWFVRPGLDRYVAHEYLAPPHEGQVTATWFGTTAVLLQDGAHALFVDPYFTRPPGVLPILRNASIAPDETLITAWLTRAGVTKLDAVLVSHSHWDHAMDAPAVARLTGARLLGSASTANIGRGGGLAEDRIQVIRPGAPVSLGSFKVTFIESRHAGATGGTPTGDIVQPLKPPVPYMEYRQGGTYSVLVEHAQGAVLLHGSAGFVPGALAGHRADIVFLGVALLPDLEAYVANVVDAVGATRLIPTHWDDFTRPLDEPLVPLPLPMVNLPGFFDGMARVRPRIKVQTVEAGKTVRLFESP
jgi:L-ascorbate metabolism protein UlaG (beta-lactamase superfamily)